jgi:KDO2-lipid IV(A) lauroyltransferase
LKNDLIYYSCIILIKLFNALPRRLALMLAGFVGEVLYLVDAKDRRLVRSQMETALGFAGKKLKAYGRACFEMMIKNLIDVVRMKNWSKEYLAALVEVEGFENVDKVYNQGRGVIALTGHIGNFELIAAWFSFYKGYKVSVIGRRLYDRRFDRLLVSQREGFNIQNIPTTSSVKMVMKALHEGHAVGVLLDQDSTKVSGYPIDFFGRKALTAAGPMYLARKTGAPVVPMAIYRKPDDTYYMKILPPLSLEWTDDKEQDIKSALGKCNRVLEDLIRHDPTQWVWLHNRWRTKPEAAA